RAAGEADVRAALRGGVVDDHPVDRLLAVGGAQARRAHAQGEVRRVHDPQGPRAVPRAEARALRSRRRARLAVHGGTAPRRGDAPAHAADGRHVRQGAAQPERRARVARKVGVWAACLVPLAKLLYAFWTDDLTANPISYVTNELGQTTLRLLLISLSLTPLRILFGWGWQIPFRRLLGLFAFFY